MPVICHSGKAQRASTKRRGIAIGTTASGRNNRGSSVKGRRSVKRGIPRGSKCNPAFVEACGRGDDARRRAAKAAREKNARASPFTQTRRGVTRAARAVPARATRASLLLAVNARPPEGSGASCLPRYFDVESNRRGGQPSRPRSVY